MKIKTDFVTNSSSTSYMFIELPEDIDLNKLTENIYNSFEDEYDKENYPKIKIMEQLKDLLIGKDVYYYPCGEYFETVEDYFTRFISIQDGGGDGGSIINLNKLSKLQLLDWFSDNMPDY